jgi:hypothetical protein
VSDEELESFNKVQHCQDESCFHVIMIMGLASHVCDEFLENYYYIAEFFVVSLFVCMAFTCTFEIVNCAAVSCMSSVYIFKCDN